MKTILKHKGVAECTKGEDEASDYKWYALLKEGWVFSDGRSAGTRSLFFNKLADFKYAEPVQVGETE